MARRSVLLSYKGRNKVARIPSETPSDIPFLRTEFRTLFSWCESCSCFLSPFTLTSSSLSLTSAWWCVSPLFGDVTRLCLVTCLASACWCVFILLWNFLICINNFTLEQQETQPYWKPRLLVVSDGHWHPSDTEMHLRCVTKREPHTSNLASFLLAW